jgi:hypothetical protein
MSQTNKNDIHDKIKSRLNSGTVCYHSVQKSFVILSRVYIYIYIYKKIKIYKTVVLPVVLNGCKTWSLTLTEEYRPRVCENRVLREISGPKREEDILHSLYSSLNIVRVIKSRKMM